ncbi:hypothetical protein Trydic_g15061 [Trypoxylus dichotomus]
MFYVEKVVNLMLSDGNTFLIRNQKKYIGGSYGGEIKRNPSLYLLRRSISFKKQHSPNPLLLTEKENGHVNKAFVDSDGSRSHGEPPCRRYHFAVSTTEDNKIHQTTHLGAVSGVLTLSVAPMDINVRPSRVAGSAACIGSGFI